MAPPSRVQVGQWLLQYALRKKKAVEAFMTFSEVALKRRRSRAQMSGADFGGDQCTSWQYSSPASSGS
jgi:hypothetical protein